jgi:hypothetical protein
MSEQMNDIVVGIGIIIISVGMIAAQAGIALLLFYDHHHPLQDRRKLDKAFTILLIVLVPVNLFIAANLLLSLWR